MASPRLMLNEVYKKSPYFSPFFLLVKGVDKAGIVHSISSWNTCREGLIGNLPKIMGQVPDDKIRLVWGINAPPGAKEENPASVLSWMKRAIGLVNFYEKLAGWSLTTMDQLEYPENEDLHCFQFTGSRRWLKAPYYVSLYVLLTRIARNTKLGSYKSHADIKKIVQAGLPHDNYYGRRTVFAWETLMKSYSILFRKHKRAYYWDTGKRLVGNSDSIYREGIHLLSMGNSSDKELNKQFQEILEKGGLKDEVRTATNLRD